MSSEESGEPGDDMNTVCHSALDLAVELLEKHHSVMPFAVVLLRSGDLRLVQLGPDVVTADGTENLERVRSILADGALKGLYTATAVASDVRVALLDSQEAADTLRVEVEHIVSAPLNCFLPYRRTANGYAFDDGYLEPGSSLVFASPNQS